MSYLEDILSCINDRCGLWNKFVQHHQCESIAEIGVYKGEFSESLLKNCRSIEKYYMIDSWRNLNDWNKPLNDRDTSFEEHYRETRRRTDFAKKKRVFLRGKTTEVINDIQEGSLDLVYIDGDHTLRGITIDLIKSWSKVKDNGFIAGDDFCPSIWQHSEEYEPTLIFPFAVNFAEAMDVKIFALPYNQFLISKELNGFELINYTTSRYENSGILHQVNELKENRIWKEKYIFRKILKSLFSSKKWLRKNNNL